MRATRRPSTHSSNAGCGRRWRPSRLKPGDQLPTVRQLAVELRINANTVARVYADLERAGAIETRRGVGLLRHGDRREGAAAQGTRKAPARVCDPRPLRGRDQWIQCRGSGERLEGGHVNGRHGIRSSNARTHDQQQWAPSLNVVAVAILLARSRGRRRW